ncbi:hypothetical protein PVAP13_9KG406401 [Panicum virgatum]|uniref:Uncharacterized protein n=1 Tax=Panicum virgatum TaxID=38727 RepID=A0A8T0NRZ9_PANVG|nr:hypothetical protein PVAP13_9KG406401 [Panicum virgatum]KAG2551608.1 hypothetical protein PVAP13_9KG406401 [Panicum virgatum]KAG2551609.1 hypothetical protein PVAP13_9KG406401 [Panicum virgatum]
MPRRMVMARKGFWGKEAWLLRPLLLCTQQWNKLRPFGIALGIRCFYYFKHMGMPSSRWSVGILQVWTSQAHDPNRSHAFSRSKGLVVCSNISYQRTEGKGLAFGLMQSLVKVGLFCTCMSLLAYALQVTMTKEEITVPFESTVFLL